MRDYLDFAMATSSTSSFRSSVFGRQHRSRADVKSLYYTPVGKLSALGDRGIQRDYLNVLRVSGHPMARQIAIIQNKTANLDRRIAADLTDARELI
jgi:hypothetical protein